MPSAIASPRPAGGAGTPPPAPSWTPLPDVAYRRPPLGEALRGRREVLEVLCSDRSRASLPWLPAAARVVGARRLDETAGSPDHQGVVARVAPYPYADAAD